MHRHAIMSTLMFVLDHSDFVRLDPDMVEEVNLCNPVAAVNPSGLSGRQDVMQSSASSTRSSISVNFRFVHPVAGQPGRYSDGAGQYPWRRCALFTLILTEHLVVNRLL